MNILDEIVENKRKEIEAAKRLRSPADLKRAAQKARIAPRGFRKALAKGRGPVAVIAELKKKSPSRGVLAPHFRPEEIALKFNENGASALSVLTDEKYFGGKLEYLQSVRKAVPLPLLRKDFIVDEYQVYESLLAGADAVLLIAAVLSGDEMARLKTAAESLGLDALLEVHTESDMRKVKGLGEAMVGINNRDLTTFEVSLEVTAKLMRFVSKGQFVVSESGIRTHQDLLALKKLGVGAVLVGESLITEKDPGAALKRLLGK